MSRSGRKKFVCKESVESFEAGYEPASFLGLKPELKRNRDVNVLRLAIQLVRIVLPLAKRGDGGWLEHWIAADSLNAINTALFRHSC